jgi:hypothetical protein
MKSSIQSDFEIFNEAVVFSKKRGYIVPPLEWAVLVKGGRDFGKTNSMRMWALGLIYSHDFLKAFFGENLIPREEDGDLMMRIGLWAKQVAVEYQNKVYEVPEGRREWVTAHHPPVTYEDIDTWTKRAPAEIVEAHRVVHQLTDMAGSIPVRTHRIKESRVDNITIELPAWKHGLRQMTEYDNPFLYLKKYMDYIKEHPNGSYI